MRFGLRFSPLLLKLAVLLVLLMLLSIPLGKVSSLVAERSESRDGAMRELADTYTGAQTLFAPLLVVPFVESWSEPVFDDKGRKTGEAQRSVRAARLLYPQQLRIDGSLAPQARYRGIFELMFYRFDGRLEGRMDSMQLPKAQHPGGRVTMGAPHLALTMSDVRGIEGMPQVLLDGSTLRFEASVPNLNGSRGELQGIHAPLDAATTKALFRGEALTFAMDLKLTGQQKFSVVPASNETEVHLKSHWPHPSFDGKFLPVKRSIDDQGFDAIWRVSALNSSAIDQLTAYWDNATLRDECDSAAVDCTRSAARRSAPSETVSSTDIDRFGVSLVQPLDPYYLTHRAAKYGMLFIGLVLMGAFLFELLARLRLHPVQYALVGLSIALFFLLLLALSEKLPFWQAYAVSALASVTLLSIYFSAVLGGWRRGLGLGAFCAALYAALYASLASERHALLLGALLTFGMLALLMLMTRHVDWWALAKLPAPAAPSDGNSLPAARQR